MLVLVFLTTLLYQAVLLSSGLDTPPIVQKWRLQGSSLAALKPAKPRTVNNQWQVVEGDIEQLLFLFSAFYDDRPKQNAPTVRIIVVAQTDRIIDKLITCLLWYETILDPDVVPVVMHISSNINQRGGISLASYVFSCPIQRSGHVPQYVSLVTKDTPQVTTLQRIKHIEQPSLPNHFGICVKLSLGDIEPLKIVEWMEIYKRLGVSGVTIYDNGLSPRAAKVMKYYAKMGFVDYRKAQTPFTHDEKKTIELGESSTLNDCMYTNMYRYKKLVVVGLHEVIIPRKHKNYANMLTSIEHIEKTKHAHRSYQFYNAYFLLDFPPEVPAAHHVGAIQEQHGQYQLTETQLQKLSKLKIKPLANSSVFRHIRRLKPSYSQYSSKSIIDPMACVALQNQICWSRLPYYDTPSWYTVVEPNVAVNHQYKACHFDKYHKRQGVCARLMMQSYVDMAALKFYDKNLNDEIKRTLVNIKTL